MTDAQKVSHPSLRSPGPGQGQLLRDRTRMKRVKEDGGEEDPVLRSRLKATRGNSSYPGEEPC